MLTVLFLLAFALTSRGPMPRTAAILLGFFAAFLLVYLLGYFNLETKQALDQFTKGMVKYVLHFLFLIAAVTYLVRRGQRYYWRALGWFSAGFVANCVYGVLQLLSARAGPQPRLDGAFAADRRRERDQRLRIGRAARASTGRTRSRATRTISA